MKISLIRLLAVIGRLDPRIWDAIIPMGPIREGSMHRLSPGAEVELNPQPIPPGRQVQFAAAIVANQIAEAAVAAEAAGLAEGASAIIERAAEGWCGNEPRHLPIPWPPWPFPWPVGRHPEPDPSPWDIASVRLVSALTFASVAARLEESETRNALNRGAERLMEAALAEE